jgi:hypothetical protein
MARRTSISDPGEKVRDGIVHGIIELPTGLGDTGDKPIQCSFPECEARNSVLSDKCVTPTAELTAIDKANRTSVPRKTSETFIIALGL